MKELSTITKMSSREIAELTDKRHDNVIRDCRNLNKAYMTMSLLKIEDRDYKNTRGQIMREFLLTKMQCFDLLTGYSQELRIKVNRRWEELETQNSLPDFTNPAESARAWADQFEKRIKAEQQNAIMAPKAALADTAIRDEKTQYSITNAGKHIGIPQGIIFQFMRDHGLLTLKRMPTQKALNMGILTQKTNIVDGRNRPQAVMDMGNIHKFKIYYIKKLEEGSK